MVEAIVGIGYAIAAVLTTFAVVLVAILALLGLLWLVGWID